MENSMENSRENFLKNSLEKSMENFMKNSIEIATENSTKNSLENKSVFFRFSCFCFYLYVFVCARFWVNCKVYTAMILVIGLAVGVVVAKVFIIITITLFGQQQKLFGTPPHLKFKNSKI